MKKFIAIDHTRAGHHKHQEFDTLGDAQAHINNNLPNGFAVANPGGDNVFWIVDHAAETVTHDASAEDAENVARAWERIRAKRDIKLAESDWTQGNDSPLDDETKDDWSTYRQELRDLPDTTDDPANPTWPEVPE